MSGRGLILLGAALCGLILFAGGVAVGRSQNRRPAGPVRATPAPASAHAPPHEHERGCIHPPEEYLRRPDPTDEQRAGADARLDAIVGAPDRIRRLNELQETLAQQLADGTTPAARVLDLIRAERDPAVLEVYVAALHQNPDVGGTAEVVQAFLELAESDPAGERRRAALQFLGGAWDRDGSVRATLLKLAREEADGEIRLGALVALKEHGIKNRGSAPLVNAELISIARGQQANDVRAQAVLSVSVREAEEPALRDLAAFLQDRSVEVRLSAADAFGDARPEHRGLALAQLESAYGREPEAAVRATLMLSLVKAGRTEAAAVLERLMEKDGALRQDALDYAEILRRGETDLERIAEEKQRLEAARAK